MAKSKAKGRTTKPRSVVGDHAPCPACQVIASAASGTIFYAEDTTLVPMTPPAVYSRLVFNPQSGTPQWEALDDGGGGGGGEQFGNYAYSWDGAEWVGGPGETPTCDDPGLPPEPGEAVGATAVWECTVGEWAYYPPP